MNHYKLLAIAGVMIFLFGVKPMLRNEAISSNLRVGLPGQWNTVHPGLQHTLFGDLVLSNKFEALVGMNENGVSIPLGAKAWEISDDFKVFRFHIDGTRLFPDGSRLNAMDFKRSWEDAAKLKPISANNSLLDVLYKIEGFDQFASTGEILGVVALDENTLEVRFSSPFRMALEHLQGNRFAAYRNNAGTFSGTGFFEIEEKDKDHIIMRPGTDTKQSGTPVLDVQFIPSDKIAAKLIEGEIDVIHYMSGHSVDVEPLNNSIVGTIVGQSSLHLSIGLNNNKSSIFANKNHRAALQSLVAEAVKRNQNLLPSAPYFDGDFQFFLPFQAGRLDNHEVERIIEEGKSHIPSLVAASKLKPIIALAGGSTRRVIDLLRATGLTFSADTGVISPKVYYDLVYKSDGPDILIRAFSVASGDPDGIYHALGKNGAIRTPYIYNEQVGDLLEEGRKLIKVSSLDEHYKEVSRALLSEVPTIHLGFARALTAYRKDRVLIDTDVLRRNQGQLHFLKAKK